MGNPRKLRCEVVAVEDHGEQVFTVELKPDRPVPAFLPGQFLHLALDPYDPSGYWPESRVFSIASPAFERDHLVVTYSVKGGFTRRMAQELVRGREVWVKLPYGEFVVEGTREVVLIAGGTGITAFNGFIAALPEDHPHRVTLLYGARLPGLLLGRAAMEARRSMVKALALRFFAEQEADGVAVLPGRIQLARLEDCAVGTDALYYLAGPPAMLVAMRGALASRGVEPGRIRVDAWE